MAYFCPHCSLRWDDDILDSIDDIGCPRCKRKYFLEELEQERTFEDDARLLNEWQRLKDKGYFDKKLYE